LPSCNLCFSQDEHLGRKFDQPQILLGGTHRFISSCFLFLLHVSYVLFWWQAISAFLLYFNRIARSIRTYLVCYLAELWIRLRSSSRGLPPKPTTGSCRGSRRDSE
jgi:hypothetical protein